MSLDRNFKYLGAALMGGAIGATIGLLTAPGSGEETRRRLASRAAEEKEALIRRGRRAAEDVTQYVQDHVKEGRRKIAEVVAR